MSRLEEIRNGVRMISGNYKDVVIDAIEFDWLVEQAKRVVFLENEYQVRRVDYLEEHIERIEQQNKRYRELLKKAFDNLRGYLHVYTNESDLIDSAEYLSKQIYEELEESE